MGKTAHTRDRPEPAGGEEGRYGLDDGGLGRQEQHVHRAGAVVPNEHVGALDQLDLLEEGELSEVNNVDGRI